MPNIIVVDSGFLVAGLKVGQSAGTGTEFIDRFVESSQFSGDRLVINDVNLGEFLDPRLPTAEWNARYNWWNQNSQYFDYMPVDDTGKYSSNKGEHSIVDDTIRKISDLEGTDNLKIATVDDWLRKEISGPLFDGTYRFDRDRQILDWNSFYRDELMLDRQGVIDSYDRFRTALPNSGETGVNGSLLKNQKSGTSLYSPETAWSGTDKMRSGLADLHESIGTNPYQSFADMSPAGKAYWFTKSLEAVALLTIPVDGYFTREQILDALRKGDRQQANELLGGYIGRAFGGAFLGVLTAAAFATLPGMILGGLLGAYYGVEIGGDLGEWLFGKTVNFPFDAIDALDALGDLLRHFRSDPLVIDLDGDGVTLIALEGSNTRFDIDGDGAVERVGWAGPNDGLLVLDDNQNATVDGINELIGNTHVDGFDELATLDTNADGKIDQQDTDFSKLLIWRDANGDGISSSSELLTPTQAGIASFNLSYTNSGNEIGGSVIARVGSYTLIAGGQRAMASVQFATDETVTRPTLPEDADLETIATLPNLGGYGPIADLRTSMFHDATLEAMVVDLATGDHDFETFEDFLRGGFLDILYRWASIDMGAPSETDATLREKLIEALTGESLFEMSAGQQDRIDDVWDSIIGKFGVGFLVQAANRTQNLIINDLGQTVSELDINDPDYFAELSAEAEAALNDIENIDLAYSYLNKFSELSLDLNSGTVSGDFDAFARAFIEDQPSYSFMSAVSGGGGPPPSPPPHRNGFSIGSIVVQEEEPEPEPGPHHPWLIWYEQEGSLLFNVAAAMGIGAEYVKNVTGWQWLMKLQAEVVGTSGDDILSEIVSTVTYMSINSAPDGGTLYPVQTNQTRDQRLYGFEGNDELRGNDSADTLVGGIGNDLLMGGSGSDMYVYSAGDGLDRITEEAGDDDAVFFSSELKLDDLQVIRLSGTNDLQLHFGDTSKGIILTNQINLGGFGVERFNFVGTGPIDAGDVATIYLRSFSTENKDIITGTAAGEDIAGLGGNDTISGVDGDDFISGASGNDFLAGGNGADRLEGGTGNDIISGGDHNDTLTGGTGNDVLYGNHGDDTYVFNVGDGQDVITDDGWGNETIQLGAGTLTGDVTVSQADNGTDLVLTFAGSDDRITINDTMTNGQRRIERVTFADGTVWTHADLVARSLLAASGDNVFYGSYDGEALSGGAGNDVLIARDGNDVVTGGTGNDMLYGNHGDDTYVFNVGDGQDVITDDGWGNETIQLGAGILTGDVTVSQADNGTDLVLTFAGSDDRITINDTMTNGQRRIERVTFADGTVWTHADLVTRSLLSASGDNVFYGSYDGEALSGGAGNDILIARDGNDVVTGGTGNDMLYGNHGDDTYVFNVGDGQDVITDDGWGNETIQLGAGILTGDVTVSQADNGTDLVLTFAGSDDRITINDTMTNGQRRIERVTFADGTIWTHDDLVARISVPGTDEILTGTSSADILAGGSGNDNLIGLAGADTLEGGIGNDYLRGGDHGDTYVFNLGDGQDLVYDGGQGGEDIVQFGAGVLPSDITIVQADNGNDLVLLIAGTNDRITLDNTMQNWDGRIEKVTFADGTVWTHADLMTRSMLDNGGENIFNGSSDTDTLFGGAGDDRLYGRSSNDILEGGVGNDYLSGGDHGDTYVFHAGDGQDVVYDGGQGGEDVVQFGVGILPSDVTVMQADNGNDLVLLIDGTEDRVTLDNTMQNWDGRIEKVTFANGAVWTHADLMTRSMLDNGGEDIFNGSSDQDTLLGGAGNDTLIGRSSNDILEGGTGNDYLSGGDHDDSYIFNLGDGQDTIYDGGPGGNDELKFGAGILPSDITVMQADNGNDLVILIAGTNDRVTIDNGLNDWWGRIEKVSFADGTIWTFTEILTRSMADKAGDNIFSGSADSDTLLGGAGNDTLIGRSGNDILEGGTGNDYLSGGDHDDSYIFNLGDGQDTIYDGGPGGNDELKFGTGILPSDITVLQAENGNDLGSGLIDRARR
ncbi:Ca2+-binding RTX toxin-like protein [Sphingobium sp. OAS761]|uniref:calcium-binding protein n=1 Tax=Sphingobium sp. OAS761 TaxID=2817901 RepID=UPI002646D5B1|nr:calcium-binding protein [Sphingobium sp. OAS761]MCP1472373.1 Ca2+-binding RTX toxin-like protein [Sphingobium sp. OAS761]